MAPETGSLNMDVTPAPVNDADLGVAYEGAAVYANRFFVSIGPVARIAFAEQNGPDKKVFFRTAVSLSMQDAVALAHILADLVKPFESRLDEALAAARTAKPAG